MKRMAVRMQLKEGFETEYQKRHNEIWPELLEKFKEYGISDFSIFLDKSNNDIIAVRKIEGDAFLELKKEEIAKKWNAYMADILETNPDNSPVSFPLTEVFYVK
ncbi:MAG: L-rhamnose mutarotase [Paludibacter sp.]